MDPSNPDPKEWPFEAHIEYPDGRGYSQFARDNGNGTVSIISWGENGHNVKVIPSSRVVLKRRPWEKAKAWRNLYEEVYGEKEVQNRFSKESLGEFLGVGRELVARGKRPESELEMLNDLEENSRERTQEDWDAYNFFFTHFPSDTVDPAILITRGHFLIDQKILRNVGAFKGRPPAFWQKIRKLNFLREQVVRGFPAHVLTELVDDFIAEFEPQRFPEEGGDRLAMAIRLLYGDVHRLSRPAEESSDPSE